jgi:hypothetical protein
MGQTAGHMGVALGDVDGDGLLDLFVTHLTEENHALWLQGPRGLFQDRTAAFGLASPRWRGTGFGTVFGDFDNDGWPDLAVVNGRIARQALAAPHSPSGFWGPYCERNQLFANAGGRRFLDVSSDNAAFSGTPRVSRGLACGDLDGSGALSLLVTTVGGPARLYRNVVPQRGHWLLVRALDPNLRRDAVGASVTVLAGPRRWTGLIQPAQSYLCSCDPRAHFGLGTLTRVDAVQVLWPDGLAEAFPGGPVDRQLVLRRGEGKALPNGGGLPGRGQSAGGSSSSDTRP